MLITLMQITNPCNEIPSQLVYNVRADFLLSCEEDELLYFLNDLMQTRAGERIFIADSDPDRKHGIFLKYADNKLLEVDDGLSIYKVSVGKYEFQGFEELVAYLHCFRFDFCEKYKLLMRDILSE